MFAIIVIVNLKYTSTCYWRNGLSFGKVDCNQPIADGRAVDTFWTALWEQLTPRTSLDSCRAWQLTAEVWASFHFNDYRFGLLRIPIISSKINVKCTKVKKNIIWNLCNFEKENRITKRYCNSAICLKIVELPSTVWDSSHHQNDSVIEG